MHRQDTAQLELAPVIFPKPPSRESEEHGGRSIHLKESMRRHRTVMIVVFAVCFAMSSVVIFMRRLPMYEASSRIYISQTTAKALTDDKAQIGPYDSLVEEQIRTVTRYDVLAEAVKRVPETTWRTFGGNPGKVIENLQKMLSVARLGESFEVSISLQGHNAQAVTDLVNTITNTYVEKARHDEFFERDQRLAILRDEQTKLLKELTEREGQEEALLRDLGVGSVKSGESSPFNAQLTQLHVDLMQATEQLNTAQSNLAAMQGANGPGLQAAALDATLQDSGLSALKSSLNQQRAVLTSQMAGLTTSNPVYQQDEEQLKSIDAQLAKNTSELQGKSAAHLTDKYEADIRQKRLIVQGLEHQMAEQTAQATGSAPKFQQAQEVSAEVDHLETNYGQLEERIRELQVDSSAPGMIHVLLPAKVPESPNKNKTPLLAAILLLMSAGASVATAVGLDYLDPHIYGADDVKQVMGFAPLGMLLDHDHFAAEVSQQYLLRLAAAVHHAVRASGARTFLFTATDPQGGTSTTVDKVARQLRALNMRTLTIAASSVDGRITYVSTSPVGEAARDGGGGRPGGDGAGREGSSRSAGRALNPAGTDKLERHQPGPVALSMHLGEPAHTMFSGSFVAQILNEHQDNYDVVLIDGGPILISADAEYLARLADGTVVVTQSGRTTRTQLKRTAALLEKLHVPGVAVVLNRIQPERADAALRRDIQDFLHQSSKQRSSSTMLARPYARRAPSRESYTEPAPVEAAGMGSSRSPDNSAAVVHGAVNGMVNGTGKTTANGVHAVKDESEMKTASAS